MIKIKDARSFLAKIQKQKDQKKGFQSKSMLGLEDRKNVLDLNIAVGVDVSGSISREQFNQFMAQLNAIRGLSRVKVVEIDTEIVAMYDYFKSTKSRVIRLSGGGGTCFEKAFTKFIEIKPDAILFMTDGFVADTVENPNLPVGWILTHNGVKPYNFGEVVVKLD